MKSNYSAFSLLLLLVACSNPGNESDNTSASTPAVDTQPEAPAPTAEPTAEAPAGFSKTLALQGIEFTVESTNAGSINQLTITPSGLKEDNSIISSEIDGSVIDAEVADLDANGSPELYVYVQSAGSGSYGSLIAYAVNNGMSLSAIYLAPLEDDAINSKGYMGHDQFSVVENTLARRFPVYNEGDTNASPSGKTRQLEYKLIPGEAGWQLKLDKSSEF